MTETIRVIKHEHRWVDITTWGDLPNRVEICALGGERRVIETRCPTDSTATSPAA